MDLLVFNPWWREGRLHASLVGEKRKIFTEVLNYLDLRQILIFSGLNLISGENEKTFVKDGLTIKTIPYWKYWSIEREILKN